MQSSDIGGAMELSNTEGWNQTENDWRLLIEGDRNICIVAEWEKKIIGTTTGINYSNQTAWIGMVLVNKEYRGQGISKSLLKNILEKLKSVKSIKLDATPAGQRVYTTLNFHNEYLITRMVTPSMKKLSPDDNSTAEPIDSGHIDQIASFDELVFGVNRAQLIKSLIMDNPGKAWLLRRNNSIEGFSLGRIGRKYHHVGPVYATHIDASKTLLRKALKDMSNKPVVLDVPCDKEDLIYWLQTLGFTRQRDFVRMFKKENPLPGKLSMQYGICGPEFG